MNRLTNMVDSIGTTAYSYDAAGQRLTEDGPYANDTVSSTYSSRRRVALSLQQPSGAWTNGFGWDLAGRLPNVTSQAGPFGYTYSALGSGYSGRLVQELGLPGGAYITNFYDSVARVLGTVLKSSGGTTLDSALYGYNVGSQRTAYTNAAAAYVQYSYDPIGQLKVADSSTNSEDRGYAYDAAWNLSYATNNGVLATYTVDSKNELTSAPARSYTSYDANGNPTAVTVNGYSVSLVYDDENRLVSLAVFGLGDVTYAYDGLGRLRSRSDSGGQTRYIYDGWRVIQERNNANNPMVSYTRGNDLSGSLEGAGGIGGLLARSSGYSGGNWTSHAFYHADGNGNITCLIDTNQSVVASYRYDPYGNTLSSSGALAGANLYRFSSKQFDTFSSLYYFGYRFYDPPVQRWVNRDPLGEEGSLVLRAGLRTLYLMPELQTWGEDNLFHFVENDPLARVDYLGLQTVGPPGSGLPSWGPPKPKPPTPPAQPPPANTTLQMPGNSILTPGPAKPFQCPSNFIYVGGSNYWPYPITRPPINTNNPGQPPFPIVNPTNPPTSTTSPPLLPLPISPQSTAPPGALP